MNQDDYTIMPGEGGCRVWCRTCTNLVAGQPTYDLSETIRNMADHERLNHGGV